MSKAIVLGANGLLGSRLCPYLHTVGVEVITAGRSESLDYRIDVTNTTLLRQLFDTIQPDHVINLIAETNVDQCEIDLLAATRINALIPEAISSALYDSKAKNVHLVQVSTDQVYEGTGNHVESKVSPVNVYGLSKLTGELMMPSNRTAVLRTNFHGRSALNTRTSFSDWIVNSLQKEQDITLFTDVRFSALNMTTLCHIIYKAMVARLCGTFNVGCRNGISKADFAVALATELKLPLVAVKFGRISNLPLKARRPIDMTLNIQKLEETLGIQCPDIYEEISNTAREYVNV